MTDVSRRFQKAGEPTRELRYIVDGDRRVLCVTMGNFWSSRKHPNDESARASWREIRGRWLAEGFQEYQ